MKTRVLHVGAATKNLGTQSIFLGAPGISQFLQFLPSITVHVYFYYYIKILFCLAHSVVSQNFKESTKPKAKKLGAQHVKTRVLHVGAATKNLGTQSIFLGAPDISQFLQFLPSITVHVYFYYYIKILFCLAHSVVSQKKK